jgi:enamine deaminase RidA (YjgF/YER057c/UK114 family)
LGEQASREDGEIRDSEQAKRGVPPGGAYSQGWRAGDSIFVTGTGPFDPSSGKLVGKTIEEQTEQTIANVSAILEADGASLGDVVKVTVPPQRIPFFYRWRTPRSAEEKGSR